MQEASYAETNMAFDNPQAASEEDKKLLVKFHTAPLQDQQESVKQGRPIFKDVTYIHITTPGDPNDYIDRPANQRDYDRFPEHYARFQARQSQEAVSGTPLSEWPAITRSMVEELKFFNIATVENLIDMPDSNAQNIRGIHGLQEKAKAFLEASDQEAAAEELLSTQKRLEDLEAKIETLLEENAELREQLNEEEED